MLNYQLNYQMLWFDNDKKLSIEDKLNQAITYYQEKYKKTPVSCWVNPAMLTNIKTNQDGTAIIAGLSIQPSQYVIMNHFLIGDK